MMINIPRKYGFQYNVCLTLYNLAVAMCCASVSTIAKCVVVEFNTSASDI